MTEVDKRDSPCLLLVEVILSEETIGEGTRCALVDKSHALNSCDLGGIKIGLSFTVGGVRWDRDDDFLRWHTSFLEIGLYLFQVISHNLFRLENVSLPSYLNLESDFVIVHVNHFVGDEFFLLFDLLFAVLVQSQKSCEELKRVFEILFHLVNCCVSDQSFHVSVSGDCWGPLSGCL